MAMVRVTPSSLGKKFSVIIAIRMATHPLDLVGILPHYRRSSLKTCESGEKVPSRACMQDRSTMQREAADRRRHMPEDAQAATETPAPAVIAERYTVEQRVGQGGTALVYRCRDEHTGQIVALKLLRSGNPLVPASRARFAREARLAASLTHPNIIRVLDYGLTMPPATEEWTSWVFDSDQPVNFLAMEYVGGPTLKQLVRRVGPIPTPWALAVGLQLAGALASAHSLGIIHRDIKPQNILLLDLTTHDIPKLGDFGIARDLNRNTL